MIPVLSTAWYLLALALCVAAFALLALASDREGGQLLGRTAGVGERWVYRGSGWLLLVAGLVVCVARWGGEFGPLLWLGLLAVVGVALVFGIPWRPWGRRALVRARAARAWAKDQAADTPSEIGAGIKLMRLLVALAVVVLPLAVARSLYETPRQALAREDVVHGQVGPWTFMLVEESIGPPEASPSGTLVKAFALRFCPTCDAHIRSAHLKWREPHPPHYLGNPFRGDHWSRVAALQFQPGLTLDDQIWLTVTGKDGSTHQIAFDVGAIAPSTALLLQGGRR